MNRESVQTEINKIIEENRNNIGGRASRNQYKIAKHQENTLRELGLLEMMPNAPYAQHIGHSDAKAVIEAAQDSGKDYGDFDDSGRTPASELYKLMNVQDEAPIKVGDYVQVGQHSTYSDLRGGAIHSVMDEHAHGGYKRVKVVDLLTGMDESDVIVVVEVGGNIDEVPLKYCTLQV